MDAATPPFGPDSRPRLRPGLTGERAAGGVVITDPHRVGDSVHMTAFGLEIVQRFDGTNTLADVRAKLSRLAGGVAVPLDTIAGFAVALDEALLLDSPRFHAVVNGPVRPPSCAGSYDADPDKLRAQLRELFTAPGGPGLPAAGRVPSPHGRLRAALLPHMDYARGNVTYGWGFKELIERTDARVFVIVATSHYSHHRFTLTRQHFETPLGVAETNRAYVDRIEAAYGPGLFDDATAHLPEHSVELEVVLLQYLLADRGPFTIVPLLVGSFADCVARGDSPAESDDVGRMVVALRAAEACCPEPVCYLISGDLAHIGPKFRDQKKAAGPWLVESRDRDQAILAAVGRADPSAYFEVIAAEGDRRRICGLPPTYLTLETVRPQSGRVLHYQQYVHPQGRESVSFAAAAFYD